MLCPVHSISESKYTQSLTGPEGEQTAGERHCSGLGHESSPLEKEQAGGSGQRVFRWVSLGKVEQLK